MPRLPAARFTTRPAIRPALFAFFVVLLSFGVAPPALADTQVIVLGTGTPVPDPDRVGASVAVVVDGRAYLFDAGSGALQRAIQAAEQYDIPGLQPQNVEYLFLTHLHSDHIHDVADFASSRWWSRQSRLRLFGPAGTVAYNAAMTEMATIEADLRAAGTPAQLITNREGFIAQASDISTGLVFSNDDLRVEAFAVSHGDIKPAYGYKITTADKSLVISGDTAYSEKLAEMAAGVDLLIHEVMSGDRLATQSEFWQLYHGSSHTRASDVARIANQAQPGLVVLYHVLFFDASAEDIVAEVTRDYDGKVVMAQDLDRF